MTTSLNKIKHIIKQKIGLDSNTIGENTLDKIINRHMKKCDVFDYDSYYILINNNIDELNELLEIAVIPETWFFRDIRPFEIIHQKIKQGLKRDKTHVFHILSIPCSTGEEPYSISMYLIDHGIPTSAFVIDAVDVSKRALTLAKQGCYSKNSFRGKNYHDYQEKCFSREDTSYIIKPLYADQVNFESINILNGSVEFNKKFEFVLCRNLLIYFDEQTKLTAFKQLEKFMKEDGILYIGHSEFGAIPNNIFKNTGSDNAFGLIKQSEIVPIIKKSISKPYTPITRKPPKAAFKTINNKPNTTISLDEIRSLADANSFEEAERLCLQYTKTNNETPESLYLLALISNCLKKEKTAESLFRKVLFLNPKHYESLLHLALILENRGDFKKSDLLKKRAQKTLSTNTNNR